MTCETDDFNAEVSLDTFGKELGLFGVSFGSLITKFKLRGPLGLRKFVILRHDFFLDLILS